MSHDDLVELFLGVARDVPTREAARARLEWIKEEILGPAVLDTSAGEGALAMLLARPGLELVGTDRRRDLIASAQLLLSAQEVDTKKAVRFDHPENLGDAMFDTVILASLIDPETAVGRLRLGGRLLLTVPYGNGSFASDIVEALRPLVTPHALFVRDGWIHFAGTHDIPLAEDWEEIASDSKLLALTEAAARDLLELHERRVASLKDAKRTLISNTTRRARSTERSLRATIEQNARLHAALERTRRSARYQLGSAVIGAAKPSKDILKFPGRLLEIYRAKTGDLPSPGHEQGTSDIEPRRQLLDARLDRFLAHGRREPHSRVVVMFTGTTVGALRGNRPYLLARRFLSMGISVLFGYHGSLTDEDIPSYENPLFLELPVDYLMERMDAICAFAIGAGGELSERIFINSYPIPNFPQYLNQLNTAGWTTIYDCLDDWEEFANAGFASWYSGSAERFIINNSDVTCCVSRPLQAKLQGYAGSRTVELSPNALNRSFVAPSYAWRGSETIKIGYFGHLTPAWFDWNALMLIARKRPDFRFEIIGHGEPSGLNLPLNVRLFGAKTPHEISSIAAEWRAAIIPFKVGHLADAVDPIKIYEYLALGLPVVSFRMPQIASYPYTKTVTNTDEFLEALDQAIQLRPDKAVLANFLDANTWEVRAQRLLELSDVVQREHRFEKSLNGATP